MVPGRLSALCALIFLSAPRAGAQAFNTLSPTERDSGFALLFDGVRIDTSIWRKWNGNLHGSQIGPQWTARDGTIEKNKYGFDILIDSIYTHFVFKMEFKVTSDNPAGNREGNSGVFYRTLIGCAAVQSCGVEYQIRDILQATPQATGSLYGGIAPSPYPWRSGEWNSLEIRAEPDSTVRHYLNGRLVVTYKFGSEAYYSALVGSGYSQGRFKDPLTGKDYQYGHNPSGYIAIQDYGEDMRLNLRNIKVLRLPLAKPVAVSGPGARYPRMRGAPGRIRAAEGVDAAGKTGGTGALIKRRFVR